MAYKHTIRSTINDVWKGVVSFPLSKWKLIKQSYRESKLTFFVQLINIFLLLYFAIYTVPGLHLERISPFLKTLGSSIGVLSTYFIGTLFVSYIAKIKTVSIVNHLLESNLQLNLIVLILLILSIVFIKILATKVKILVKKTFVT